MLLIAVFMISVPIVLNTTQIGLLSISNTLSGRAIGFLAVTINFFSTALSTFSAAWEGEVMGLIMLGTSLLASAIYLYYRHVSIE